MSEVKQGVLGGYSQTPTRNGGTRFAFSFSDGNTYSTFDRPVADKLAGLIGQQVNAVVEAKANPNGNSPFLNILDATPLLGQIPGVTTVPQVTQIPTQVAPEVRDARISRGNAVNGACAFLAGSGATTEELLALVSTLARYIALGPQKAAAQGIPGDAPTPATTPEAVAAEVNGAVPGAIQVGAVVEGTPTGVIPY